MTFFCSLLNYIGSTLRFFEISRHLRTPITDTNVVTYTESRPDEFTFWKVTKRARRRPVQIKRVFSNTFKSYF